jgi:predicted MPP superfamily phosphohydrolase
MTVVTRPRTNQAAARRWPAARPEQARQDPRSSRGEVGTVIRLAPQPAGPPWPAPDPDHRDQWRRLRQAIEDGPHYHTPWGARRRRRLRPLDSACRALRASLHGCGLLPLVTRSALDVQLREFEIPFDDLPPAFDGYTILHITDPHFDALPDLGEAIRRRCAGLEVDLCVFTGDYRGREIGRFTEHGNFEAMAGIVGSITARDGTLAVLGNHDTHDMLEPIETVVGARVLTNETVDLVRGGQRLAVLGLDDVHRFYSDSTKRFLADLAPCAPDEFRIMLVHSPELAQHGAQLGCSLYLCGHTHGGQICLPGGRPILRHLHGEHRLARGLWRRERLMGYTSAGAGVSESLPIRLFSRSEVTLFRLRALTPDA